MSAYAALVSLRQNLVSILYPEPRIIHSRAELRILLDEVDLLLKFLDKSSTYKASQISALETKTRVAAHKAEDLIEYGILDSETRISYDSIRMNFLLGLYNIVVISFSSWVHLFYASVWMGLILELVLCTTNAMVLYLYIRKEYIFPAINDSHELSQVMYDFNIIVKEITEAGGVSAQAALSSLRQILDPILDSDGRRISRNRAHLECLHEKVSSLLDFLGNTPAYMSTINDAVFKTKIALIEFQPPSKFISVDFDYTINDVSSLLISSPSAVSIFFRLAFLWNVSTQATVPFCFVFLWRSCIVFATYIGSVVIVFLVLAAQYNSEAPEKQELLSHSVDDFTSIWKDVTENASGESSGSPAVAAAAASSRRDMEGSGRDVIVGLDEVLIEIKDSLLQGSKKRQLVSIVGMGGIGKTTLARQVYKDPVFDSHFDFHAWVTVSQENSSRHALLSLLDSANLLTDENRQDDNKELAVYLHKHLMYRKYLIVLDDVWDTEIWEFLRSHFPENNNGSRVLLTSRLPNVATHLDSSSCLHHMQCLNENHSWDLLCIEVFGVEGCPHELESIGKKIVQRCGGLPLAILVIGGLLYKDIQVDVWRDVAEKLDKIEVQDIKEQCLEILGFSYNNLPHHLRPCFLYMGAFLRDREILISRLVNLLVAEGFLERRTSQTLEEVAEVYLEDLINRNLIVVCKRSFNGKNRTCSMHDLLRDVCVQNARKENFLHVVDSGGYVTQEWTDESPRRFSIHPGALQDDAKHDSVRSVLCFASKPTKKSLVMYLGFLCLRVLDLLEVQFGEFPHRVTKLHCLRYLAFHYNGSIPPSISKLQNLETIVHHHSSSRKYPSLPRVIWSMQNLRHIYVKPGCYLSNPLSFQLPLSFSKNVLHDLQTLVGIRNFKWTRGIIRRVPNLKKLGISYDVPSSVDWSMYQLESLVDLHQLETLKIFIECNDDVGSAVFRDPPKLAFPQKLKNLSLSGCRIPWEGMAAIGALQNLEALKLKREAFSGPSWETVEGQFPKLVFLLLEEMSFTTWETEESHFPLLRRLVIRSCDKLDEIPLDIGDIPTLEVIELDDCPPCAVASAKQIEEEQRYMGKEVLIKVHNEGRRVVDETNWEARGMGPGVFQLVSDAFQSARNEITMVFDALAAHRLIRRWFLSGKFW